MKNDTEKIRRLISVLRGPRGCAWDRKQTLRTMPPMLIEEAYETAEAIEMRKPDLFVEELGDLLFLALTMAACAEKEGWTTYAEVVKRAAEKYVNQHPHVFAVRKRMTPAQILSQWESHKAAQKNARHPIDRVPKSLPALYQAKRIYDKAARLKLLSLNPRRIAARATVRSDSARVIGRILLAIVRAAIQNGVDPESALRAEIRLLRKNLKKRPLT